MASSHFELIILLLFVVLILFCNFAALLHHLIKRLYRKIAGQAQIQFVDVLFAHLRLVPH